MLQSSFFFTSRGLDWRITLRRVRRQDYLKLPHHVSSPFTGTSFLSYGESDSRSGICTLFMTLKCNEEFSPTWLTNHGRFNIAINSRYCDCFLRLPLCVPCAKQVKSINLTRKLLRKQKYIFKLYRNNIDTYLWATCWTHSKPLWGPSMSWLLKRLKLNSADPWMDGMLSCWNQNAERAG